MLYYVTLFTTIPGPGTNKNICLYRRGAHFMIVQFWFLPGPGRVHFVLVPRGGSSGILASWPSLHACHET
jgi:hypothetical protein